MLNGWRLSTPIRVFNERQVYAIWGEGRLWFEYPEACYDSLNYSLMMETVREHPRLEMTIATNCMQPLTLWNTRVPYMTRAVPCFSRVPPTWRSGANFAELNLVIPSYTKGTNTGSLYFIPVMCVLRFLCVGIVWKETFLPAAKGAVMFCCLDADQIWNSTSSFSENSHIV
jgi:hypothetical protein